MVSLPEPRIKTPGNKFQVVKHAVSQAKEDGMTIINLGVGEPTVAPPRVARESAAEFIRSDEVSLHGYQDNGCKGFGRPNEWARRFVAAHSSITHLTQAEHVMFLPIPGIKPTIPQVIMACLEGHKGTEPLGVYTMTNPGYPTPAVFSKYLEHNGARIKQWELWLTAQNQFRFDLNEVIPVGDNLLMVNYQHNTSGQITSRTWWMDLCAYCEGHGIRLFNDAAYAGLVYGPEHWNLADVATHFPKLSWAEAYSSSKLTNFCGWRIGAVAGSNDFISDIATVKGEMDSGFVAPLALAVLRLIEGWDDRSIRDLRETYYRRLKALEGELTAAGMRLALSPQAGFFTFWHSPRYAFQEEMSCAEEFNTRMIRETGVVGVPFGDYIRYSVCGDVEAMTAEIQEGFHRADVSY